jgi:hypothetical protein
MTAFEVKINLLNHNGSQSMTKVTQREKTKDSILPSSSRKAEKTSKYL